jgi:hypothetical protein
VKRYTSLDDVAEATDENGMTLSIDFAVAAEVSSPILKGDSGLRRRRLRFSGLPLNGLA